MLKAITVFSGSAEGCPQVYRQAAEELGRELARQGRVLVYGSGACGLMGCVAKGLKDAGGYLVGINVKRFACHLPYPGTDELLMLDTLPERKAALIDRSRHLILQSVHPSPLSANRGGWFGNRHFSQANAYLAANGITPIQW